VRRLRIGWNWLMNLRGRTDDQGGGNRFDEVFENSAVGLCETVGNWRKDLEQSDNSKIGDDGNGHEGGDVQGAANIGIEARIIFGIFTRDESSGANALTGQAMGDIDGRSERRGWFAGAGTTDHDVAIEAGQGRAAGAGQSEGAPGDELQNGIDVTLDLTNFAAKGFDWRSAICVIRNGNDSARTRGAGTLQTQYIDAGRL